MKKIYSNLHNFCHKTFYDPHSKDFIFINNFLSVLSIVSVIVIVLESIVSLSGYHSIFLIVEYIVVFFFSLEYFGRILGAKHKLKYIFSFFGIIDLISIIPTYLHLGNLTPLKSARALRILRLLRILRITKVARIQDGSVRHNRHDFEEIYNLNVKIYLLAFVSIVTLLGSFAYVFEHGHNGGFDNILISMLWVFSIAIENPYLQVAPETVGGFATAIASRFLGLVLLGFLIHIVGNLINRLLLGLKKTNGRDGINGEM